MSTENNITVEKDVLPNKFHIENIVKDFCYKRIGKWYLYDDYVNTGIVIAINCIPSYNKNKSSFITYMKSCVRNRLINFIRDNKSLHNNKEVDASTSPEGFYMDDHSAFEILDCLNKTEQEYFKYLYIDKLNKKSILKKNKIKQYQLNKIRQSIKDKIWNSYIAN